MIRSICDTGRASFPITSTGRNIVDEPSWAILACTVTILRSMDRRLGRGRFFNSKGLVSRGWRLTNWVVKGLTATFCSRAIPNCDSTKWTLIAKTVLIHKTYWAFLKKA